MKFYMEMAPPRATSQEKQVRILPNGRPMFYDNTRVKSAKKQLIENLSMHKPAEPIHGPVELMVTWHFPTAKKAYDGQYKVTRPDTDNLQKLLKDCMTAVGFWDDDAQVVSEHVEKRWSVDKPGIEIEVKTVGSKAV